jgi:hypothetical protein
MGVEGWQLQVVPTALGDGLSKGVCRRLGCCSVLDWITTAGVCVGGGKGVRKGNDKTAWDLLEFTDQHAAASARLTPL